MNYRIRKLYVILNPFLSTKSYSDKVQYIMRDSPLFAGGVPFFFEPWVQNTYKDQWKGKNVLIEFVKEFARYLKRRWQ